ncbi:MAG TPA: hypothetical protein VLH77_01660, partial [Gammaproteobacteria bacterium]|nr:hypothetical protein [Gammaproteobacteria bacterium]
TEMLATAVSLDFNRKKDQLSHYYDLFFNKKQSFWGPRIHKTAENDQARVQAYEERESLRQRHGLVLFASDQALSEEKLKERFPEPQDPILIKKTIRAGARTVEKEQFSIYGYGHKWTETILNDELVKALKENKSLMDAFSKLKAGEDIALTPDKAANLFADQLKQEEFKQDEAVDLLADQQEQEEFKQDEAADLFANQPEQEEFKQDENYNLESIIRLYHTPDLANHHSNKVIEYPVKTNQAGKALLPLSIGDQIKSRAALSLIKDYYAPKGWLPSFFTQCTRGEYGHLLRRAFNFHWGRRYCTEARGLYLELSTQSLKTTEDFRLFYKKIKGEFERFDEVNSHLPQLQVEKKKRLNEVNSQLPQLQVEEEKESNEVNSQLPQLQVEEEKESKEVNSQLPQLVVESEAKKKIDNRKGKHNNPFQSSYLRRLNYILNSLEETLAYQQQTGLSDQVYLDSLDMRDYMNNTTTPKPK